MTEKEWLRGADHSTMLAFLHGKEAGGFRKYRLLLCAYCRTFLPLLMEEERTRRVVELSEAYADGAAEKGELARARRAALKAVEDKPRLDLAVRGVTHGLPKRQAAEFPYFCLRPHRRCNYNRPTAVQGRRLGQLIRDLFGNPFRPVRRAPEWLTPTVKNLATVAYDERLLLSGKLDGTRLAVLSDALEEAGCTDADILDHLRSPGLHIRGCWPLDLILGKE